MPMTAYEIISIFIGILALLIEDAPKQKEDFWNTINGNKVNINLLTDDDVKIVEDGSIRLIVIHVPRADFNMRPVYVGENLYKGTYKRKKMAVIITDNKCIASVE